MTTVRPHPPENDPIDVSATGMVIRLLRRFPIRYGVNVALWLSIWAMPVLPGFLIERYFQRVGDGAGGIAVLALMMAAYGLGRAAVIVIGIWNDSSLNFRIEALLRRNLLRRIYELPGAQAGVRAPGETISRFREDVEFVAETSGWTVDGLGGIITATVAAIILARIDPVLTALVFTPSLIIIAVAVQLRTRIRRAWDEARTATGTVTEAIGELFASTTAVKVAGAETSMLARLGRLSDDRRDKMVRVGVLEATLEALFANIVNIGTGLILLAAAGSMTTATDDGGGLTVGRFALFVYLTGVVYESGAMIGSTISRLKQSSVSFQRMAGLLQGATLSTLAAGPPLDLSVDGPAARRTSQSRRSTEPLESLSIRGLTFHYPGTDHGITNIDLDIAGGSFTVIVGRIGAGKTTLLRAVLGLLPRDAGEIRWNGGVVHDPAAWFVPPRAAYTPQVPRLLSMSLRDNITLGRDHDDEMVRVAMEVAAFDGDVSAMPDGLDTMVGPLGVRLSGGQMQRTAAARMLVTGAELLVFDDLSSALDVETELRLWDGLAAGAAGATALVVSHRRVALERADRIVVVDGGRIVSEGRLADLEASSPEFGDILARNQDVDSLIGASPTAG